MMKVRAMNFKVILTCCVGIIMAVCVSCSPREDDKHRGVNDLNNAIEVIEGRRSAEQSIVVNHEREIGILAKNLDKVHSDKMRKMLQSEIDMKQLGIKKAKKNMANQDVVLHQLLLKRDSLVELQVE
jgi:hypothetical protein